jgi:G6PDH family F420-dependent oxidoreductase
MVQFGYKLMTEEHGPKALVENAVRAEAAGFDFVCSSDHFHPWVDAQGHSPFAWSVLGAIAHATKTVGIATGLTCPIIRYHPAIIAQAAATVASLSDGRFTLAVGAGERLNEHITGAVWPSLKERHAMLAEAIDIFRMLWSGETCTHGGAWFELDHARLFDLPDGEIPVVVGVSGPQSLEMALESADGIMATEADKTLVDAFKSSADTNGPCYTEVALAYGPTKAAALKMAHERFSFSALGWSVMSELPTPEAFEAATKFVRPEDVAENISAGPDVEDHVAAVKKYVDAGFDHISLVGIGPDQAGFIEFFERELGPRLRELA